MDMNSEALRAPPSFACAFAAKAFASAEPIGGPLGPAGFGLAGFGLAGFGLAGIGLAGFGADRGVRARGVVPGFGVARALPSLGAAGFAAALGTEPDFGLAALALGAPGVAKVLGLGLGLGGAVALGAVALGGALEAKVLGAAAFGLLAARFLHQGSNRQGSCTWGDLGFRV